MKSTSIVRRIDDIGRIAIPKNFRRDMHINEGDPMEIYLRNGEIVIRKYKRSFEQCAKEWHDEHINLMDKCNFIYCNDYTFCIVPAGLGYSQHRRAGHAKRYASDQYNTVVARVASYANAMGKNVNEMIGYED